MQHPKIGGELRPVDTLHPFVVPEDGARYTSSGITILPDEAHEA